MLTTEYPERDWGRSTPEEMGMSAAMVTEVEAWMETHRDGRKSRLLVVRGGRIVAERNHGLAPADHLELMSASKSVFSCILAIEVRDGVIPSLDTKLIDVYPEALGLTVEEGPKQGRYVTRKDREITLRQLIANTSGYMKPDEKPGMVFNYQTYGMNVLTHAMARAHGDWDVKNPEGSSGLAPVVNRKLRDLIGARWGYYTFCFNLHERARHDVYGFFDGLSASTHDMARLGWLWLNRGRWKEVQIVPESWMCEAVRVNPDIMASGRSKDRLYGYGFWSNQFGLMWPDLPRDSFCAHGAGNHMIWVCPSLDLVVVESPGVYGAKDDAISAGLLERIAGACG